MDILISLVYNYSGEGLCALGRTGRIPTVYTCCGIAEFSTGAQPLPQLIFFGCENWLQSVNWVNDYELPLG